MFSYIYLTKIMCFEMKSNKHNKNNNNNNISNEIITKTVFN